VGTAIARVALDNVLPKQYVVALGGKYRLSNQLTAMRQLLYTGAVAVGDTNRTLPKIFLEMFNEYNLFSIW